jgi:DNA-binding NarL/FixJ family response regulator
VSLVAADLGRAIRVRALLADDHLPTRERLRLTLEAAGFSVCASVPDAHSAVEVARDERPDLCVLDISMPGGGIKATREIAAVLPATVIVMLTVSRDDADLFDALQSGACGYLLKDVDLRELPNLLWRALEGEALLSGELAARLVDEFRERGRRRRLLAERSPSASLTRREWQVLELLSRHLSTNEVAERLFVEPVTVRSHVASILRKLRVPTRAAALRLLDSRNGPVGR